MSATAPARAAMDAVTPGEADREGETWPGGDRWPWSASWPLALLTLISVFNYLDRSLLGLALPLIKREFQSSDTVLGLVSGVAFVLLYSFVGLPIAWLADRSNRRNILAAGLAFWSLMTVVTGYVSSIIQLALARLFLGVGEACALPSSNSIIADLFHPRRRPLALAIFGTANSIAFVVFFPMAGWIAQAYGWRAMFVAMGLPGLAVALLLVLTVREPMRRTPPPPRVRGSLRAIGGDIAGLFSNRCFVWLFCSVTLMGANIWAAGAWFPTFFARVHDMSITEVAGTIGPVRGIVGALGVLAGGFLIDRIPANRVAWRILVPAISCLLVAPSEALFLLGNEQSLWLTGLVLSSFVTLIHQGPIFAATMNIVPQNRRALAIAMILFGAGFIGNVLGPGAVGIINDLLAPTVGDEAVRYSLLIVAVTPVAAALCMARAALLYRDRPGAA